jgi:hypothetical protein
MIFLYFQKLEAIRKNINMLAPYESAHTKALHPKRMSASFYYCTRMLYLGGPEIVPLTLKWVVVWGITYLLSYLLEKENNNQ